MELWLLALVTTDLNNSYTTLGSVCNSKETTLSKAKGAPSRAGQSWSSWVPVPAAPSSLHRRAHRMGSTGGSCSCCQTSNGKGTGQVKKGPCDIPSLALWTVDSRHRPLPLLQYPFHFQTFASKEPKSGPHCPRRAQSLSQGQDSQGSKGSSRNHRIPNKIGRGSSPDCSA